MAEKFMGNRGDALEANFFKKAEAEKLQVLQEQQEKKAIREELAKISQIENPAILDLLIELEIRPETFSAVSLIPLVFVAWADGNVDAKEKKAILDFMEHHGVEDGSFAHERLEYWLEHQPEDNLFSLWKDYISDLVKNLTPEHRKGLSLTVVGRAQMIAEASGGVLGMGNKISKEEKEMITKIESCFQ